MGGEQIMQKSSEKLSKQALKKVKKFLKTLKKQEKPLFAMVFNFVLHFNSFGISKIQLNLKMCFSKAMEIVKMLMQNGFVVFVNTPAKVCLQNIMKRDYITQERMEHLLDEKIVERHDDFDLVPHNFEISAFDNNFEKDYEQLVELIKTDLKNKKQEKNIKNCKNFQK